MSTKINFTLKFGYSGKTKKNETQKGIRFYVSNRVTLPSDSFT